MASEKRRPRPSIREYQRAYASGSKARHTGETRTDNPYDEDDPLNTEWDWGWTDTDEEIATQKLHDRIWEE